MHHQYIDSLDKPQRLTPELREQIRSAFNKLSEDDENFPSTIDPRNNHVRLIAQYFGSLQGKRVLDVGCGKGRFARVFAEANPDAEIWGLDISEEMSKHVIPVVYTRVGSMTRLPFSAANFDFAYATESLEHAVEIDISVAEMCRVLKPGGKLVIIDKNAEHAGAMEVSPWEKWFYREELERLLSRYCRIVTSRFVSYWPGTDPNGAFIAWMAQR